MTNLSDERELAEALMKAALACAQAAEQNAGTKSGTGGPLGGTEVLANAAKALTEAYVALVPSRPLL
jgi:hypothetical protein